jgi:hypothetical protein
MTEAMQKLMQLPDPYQRGYRASAFMEFAQEEPGTQYEGEEWLQRLTRLTVTST